MTPALSAALALAGCGGSDGDDVFGGGGGTGAVGGGTSGTGGVPGGSGAGGTAGSAEGSGGTSSGGASSGGASSGGASSGGASSGGASSGGASSGGASSGGASSGGTSSGGTSSGGGGGTPPTLSLSAELGPSGCSLTTSYEVWNVARADGTPVSNFSCHWTFDDDATSNDCVGQHTFASPGFHTATVVVTEVGTGATGTAQSGNVPIWDALTIDVVAEAPACGLWFTYATTKSGGKPTGGQNFASLQPWENVLTPGPWSGDEAIEVSAPGTYVITVHREEETAFSLCTASDTTQVIVTECP
jgi:hypothetical protein